MNNPFINPYKRVEELGVTIKWPSVDKSTRSELITYLVAWRLVELGGSKVVQQFNIAEVANMLGIAVSVDAVAINETVKLFQSVKLFLHSSPFNLARNYADIVNFNKPSLNPSLINEVDKSLHDFVNEVVKVAGGYSNE